MGAAITKREMNAYLFTAGVTKSQTSAARGFLTWDTCMSAIICGGDPARAQKEFEAYCQVPTEGQEPMETRIKKVVAGQFVDQLLTESGSEPLDWSQIAARVLDPEALPATDDFEQGYWVDVNQAVPGGKIASDVETLKRDLPEDIWSGLNWSPEKRFLFVVSILSPPPPPPDPDAEFEPEAMDRNEEDEETGQDSEVGLDSAIASLPELREKEAVALVEARNSVVAGWLWRRFAAGTPLASNEIQIGPCSNLIEVL